MRKISLYSLLVAAVLFTGCSEKNVGMTVDNSESALNNIPDTKIDNIADGSFSFTESVESGAYYTINGKKVLIENIYFDFDKYNIRENMKETSVNNASKLSTVDASATIKVSGNTDEWGTDEYNYALGLKRAKAVKDSLVSNGVKHNITLVSLGESNPVCTQKNQTCWQKNRRVEHTINK